MIVKGSVNCERCESPVNRRLLEKAVIYIIALALLYCTLIPLLSWISYSITMLVHHRLGNAHFLLKECGLR